MVTDTYFGTLDFNPHIFRQEMSVFRKLQFSVILHIVVKALAGGYLRKVFFGNTPPDEDSVIAEPITTHQAVSFFLCEADKRRE